MATARMRAGQEAEAMANLIAATGALADAAGVEAPTIPKWDRDHTLLPILQKSAISAFLNQVTEVLGTPKESLDTPVYMPVEKPDPLPTPARKGRGR